MNILGKIRGAVAGKSPERAERERSRMKAALEQAYMDGYSEAERLWSSKLEQAVDDMKEEYGVIFASKEVQIEQQKRTISDQETQLADARRAYRNYYHASIANRRMVAEITHNVQRMFNMSGDIFKSFIAIHDSADENVRKMIKADAGNRELLGMAAIPHEGDAVSKAEETYTELAEIEDEIDGLNRMQAAPIKTV